MARITTFAASLSMFRDKSGESYWTGSLFPTRWKSRLSVPKAIVPPSSPLNDNELRPGEAEVVKQVLDRTKRTDWVRNRRIKVKQELEKRFVEEGKRRGFEPIENV